MWWIDGGGDSGGGDGGGGDGGGGVRWALSPSLTQITDATQLPSLFSSVTPFLPFLLSSPVHTVIRSNAGVCGWWVLGKERKGE